MKVIIEEGDAGGLAPGVYDVKNTSASTFNGLFVAGLTVDLAQKPKPLPKSERLMMVAPTKAQAQAYVRAFTNHVKPTDPPPPVATCDKTFADCAKHGNTLQYCGYVNVSTGKHVPCPLTFGEPACTGGVEFKAPPKSFAEMDSLAEALDPELTKITLDVGRGDPLTRQISEALAMPVTGPLPRDCDECYGTGLYKGYGGPCSEGCPTKGGK